MRLFNTLSRQLEEVKPLNDATIKLYTCGLTVYSQPHIGNWVGYVYWDLLVKTLRLAGFNVMRVQNYTDVGHLISDDDSGEDKMQTGAKREGVTAWDLAEKYIKIAEDEAYTQLGLRRPDFLVRATDCITEQIAFVKELEHKGFTYTIKGEGIYFDTSKLSDYGKLARLDIAGLEAGARVSVEGKRNITDFALWKFSPKTEQRDMEWDSPWGKGFPGWHLECSTIAREKLGDQIDIHTGGIDHIPVHHTNEIAQTEALTGKQFSTYWLHNNHMKVDGTKMSKSLGNIYTLQDIQDRGFTLEAFKLLLLSKHYRTEGNFTWDNLAAAQNRLRDIQAWADLRYQPKSTTMPEDLDALFKATRDNITAALMDDLNSPKALMHLNTLITHMMDIAVPGVEGKYTEGTLQFLDDIFGLNLANRPDISDSQKQIIIQRETARQAKDWSTSDSLRDELLQDGIGLRDTPYGAYWYRI